MLGFPSDRRIYPARGLLATALAVSMIFACAQASAQESTDALAKKLANPVSSLISVPMQYNVDFDIGRYDGTLHKLNVQPVIPMSLSDDWNLITRVIVPLVDQRDIIGPSSSEAGMGDMTPSFFFSPKRPTSGGWVWGVGPAFMLPTATDNVLGTEKWSAGPTAVVLKQTPGGWTFGALVNHLWSFAGNSRRNDVSGTFLQPFVARQFPGGRTVTANFESTYDWKAKAWTAPFNLSYSKVTRWGDQMLSYQAGVRYYVPTPAHGSGWGLRLGVTLLFPQR